MIKKKGDVIYNDDSDVYMGKDIVAPEPKEEYNTVRLVNLISATVKLPGSVTGTLYIWERSGAAVEVDERDAPGLLAKTLGNKTCCGSSATNHIFELMKE